MTKREQEIEFQQGLIDASQLKTCTNCIHWTKLIASVGSIDGVLVKETSMICGKWDTTPPADVIVVGCIAWEQDIPF